MGRRGVIGGYGVWVGGGMRMVERLKTVESVERDEWIRGCIKG